MTTITHLHLHNNIWRANVGGRGGWSKRERGHKVEKGELVKRVIVAALQ